jgi:sugar lactone lactonase YvrE
VTVASFAHLAMAASPAPTAAHTTTATLIATVAGPNKPLDATPDPAGRTIYFSTDGPDGPGIFRVPAAGGKVRTVLRGRPLVHPAALAVSADARRLFVADRGAGRILVVGLDGSKATSLRATAGMHPRGIEVQLRGASQRLVFTGTDPSDGRPAVFAVGADGARKPTVLARGLPLRRPQAVAIARSGAIYVSDRGSGADGHGLVLKIFHGRVTQVASAIRLGEPAGIALTRDQSKLLVSSLDPAAGTAQVLLVSTTTHATSTFDDVIGMNTAAGGLHRGLDAKVMAWADTSRSGRVYRVEP